jgi:hypothetical protein
MPASRAYSVCAAAFTASGRCGLSAHFRGELGQPDVAARKIEGGGRADRGAPVDESRTIHGHDDVAGVGVGMAQPVAWPQPLDQVEDAGGDMYWNSGAGDPQPAVHHVAQKGYVRRWGVL